MIFPKLGLNLFSSPGSPPLSMVAPPTFFRASRGLCQGCPLSPLLYILMVEALNRSLEHARKEKSIPGIKIVRGTKRLNHSQFVDDTLLISVSSTILAIRFKNILDLFTNTSGGLINNAKSHLFTWNTSLTY
jgi:hypothetical protein